MNDDEARLLAGVLRAVVKEAGIEINRGGTRICYACGEYSGSLDLTPEEFAAYQRALDEP